MPFSSKAVANYLLDRAEADGKTLNPMQYGPVVPTLYHEFKDCGGGAIRERATSVRLVANPKTGRKTLVEFIAPSIDDASDPGQRVLARDVLDKVWRVYGGFSAVELSQMTHERGGPWDVTREANPGIRGVDINDDLIREYFRAKGLANERAQFVR